MSVAADILLMIMEYDLMKMMVFRMTFLNMAFKKTFQDKDEEDDVIPPAATLVFWSWCETLANRFPFMHQLNLYSPTKALISLF